jgi:uncharacterized protein (DUF305 family)
MTLCKTMAWTLVLGAGAWIAPAAAESLAMPRQCAADNNQMAMPHEQPMDTAGMNLADFQKDFMAGMQQMNPAMMQGMMKKDPDVAFVCGMIAHHMGAIQMSQVELKYGDNGEAKQRAQAIIDAQQREIAEMTQWLDKNAK